MKIFIKNKKLIFLLCTIFLTFSSSLASAYIGLCCAHCGGNMPLNISGGGVPETFEFRLKVSEAFMSMDGLRDGTSDQSRSDLLGMPAMGKFMAVPKSMDMWMTNLSGGYSFTDDFAGMAMFMYSNKDMPMEFSSMMKANTGKDGFTMETDGLADTMLMGKYRLFTDDNLAPTRQLSMIIGASLPTGSITKKLRNHPVSADNGRLQPFGMQLGSGTVDPVIGLTYQGSKSPYWYGANVAYTGRWYDNSQGYHKGQEFKYDLYGMYQAFYNTVFHLQLNGQWLGKYSDEPDDQKNNGDGHVDFIPTSGFKSPLFDPDNYGGHKLNITAGVQLQPFPLQILELNFKTPIYQDLNGPQLKDDYRVQLTFYIEIPTKRSRRYVGAKAPSELGF